MIPIRKKDPNAVGPFFIRWCDESAQNDGERSDRGFLQGATISTSTWTVPAGITKDSDAKTAVTVEGIDYAANTVATIWLSGGTIGETYTLVDRIVTSDGRTQDQSLKIQIEEM